MKAIKDCLNKQLVWLRKNTLCSEELGKKVAALLPPSMVAHCQVGSFDKGCLVLITSDAGWATQLRFILPELRDKLRKQAALHQLLSIKVVIFEPVQEKCKVSKKKPKILSEKAKSSILTVSQHCQYSPLREALIHLARKVES